MFPVGFIQTPGFKCRESHIGSKKRDEGYAIKKEALDDFHKERKQQRQNKREVGDEVRERNEENKRKRASHTYSVFLGEL